MKLISLLIGLLIILYLMTKQLAPSLTGESTAGSGVQQEGIVLQQVPVSAKELKEFETQINNLVQDSALKTDEALQEALNQ